MKKSTRAELRIFQYMERCMCGKPVYDKKGAVTARNLRMRNAHMKLRVYECSSGSGHWHLTKKI